MSGVDFQTVSPPLCPHSFEIVLKISTLTHAGGEVEVSVESSPSISEEMDWNSFFKGLRVRQKVEHPMGIFCITIREGEMQFDAVECNMPEGGIDPFLQAIAPSMRDLWNELRDGLLHFPSHQDFSRAAEHVASVWSMHRAVESNEGKLLYADPETPQAPWPEIPIEVVSVERIMSSGQPGVPPSVSLRDILSTGLLLIDMMGAGKDRKVMLAYRKPTELVRSSWFSQYLAECAAERLAAYIKQNRPTVADEIMLAFPDGGSGQAADILERLFEEEERERKQD
jgi:hypothetical protein